MLHNDIYDQWHYRLYVITPSGLILSKNVFYPLLKNENLSFQFILYFLIQEVWRIQSSVQL